MLCYVKLKNNAAYEIMSNFSTNVKSAKDITNIDLPGSDGFFK